MSSLNSGCLVDLLEYLKNFNIAHMNIQSVPRHFDEVHNMLLNSSLHCLCFSET
jgi:hypothetical protein